MSGLQDFQQALAISFKTRAVVFAMPKMEYRCGKTRRLVVNPGTQQAYYKV